MPPRDTHGPTPLSQCSPIAELAARARDVDHLSQRIIALLPVRLRDHVRFAGLRHDRVLLLVDSPAWAARARMEQSSVLAAVHSLGLAAGSITTRVAPVPAPIDVSVVALAGSPQAASTIRTSAAAIADGDLRTAFLELAALVENASAR